MEQDKIKQESYIGDVSHHLIEEKVKATTTLPVTTN